ncbi:MAG TPA: hypothetical protein VL155_11435 [Terriglobales bacterium]|jgi:hypothetical protein|nr:hypothetical protein [Terriglobales bacterium]
MRPRFLLCGWLALILVYALAPRFCPAAEEPSLSRQQMEHFLLTAKVVKSKYASKGITNTWRLTLSDGTITHDAHFQAVDEHRLGMKFSNGSSELLFVDSYKYNIAASRLAEMLGLEDMVPVYVERKWEAQIGSLGWWLPVEMDEVERLRRKISPPDIDSWDRQMYKVRVLDELVYDTDANLTNVLIGHDWRIYRIDFTRAFRLSKNLRSAANLVRCDRGLLEKLKALNGEELANRTKGYLNKEEVKAIMARRDKIVAYFQKLIADQGENAVLY